MADETLDELGLIRHLTQRPPMPLSSGAVGPGDDAAVVPGGDTEDFVLTSDLVAEGVQFPAAADPVLVGRFAVTVSLSDVAAMGADPAGFLAAYGAPAGDGAWVAAVGDGVRDALERHRCPLIGGDTKEAAARVVVGTGIGRVPRGEAVLRSGARAGDTLLLTGTAGGPAAALRRWRAGEIDGASAARAMLDVDPHVAAGRAFRLAGAHALVDLSDGLGRAAALIAESSGVALRIDRDAVPLHDAVHAVCPDGTKDPRWSEVVFGTGGEYTLLASVPPRRLEDAILAVEATGTRVTPVGRVIAEEGAFAEVTAGEGPGATVDLRQVGWRHFRR